MGRGLLIVVIVLLAFAVTYFFLFPSNSIFIFSRSNGGTVAFSRTGVSFDPPPDHFANNGMDHIGPYVSRLLVSSKQYRYLHIFTPDGNRGFGLSAKDKMVNAGFVVDWRKEPKQEAAIRSFFTSLGKSPSEDYLGGNGDVPDATRILSYPIKGNAVELTALIKRILTELCRIGPEEPLNITYGEK